MHELSDAGPVLEPLRRGWWFVVLAAVVAGVAAYVGSTPASSVTYGVINTRTVASLPNDRLDLISDLSEVVTLPSVLAAPARLAGMSVNQLSDAVSVDQIGTTTLARITFVSDVDDNARNKAVIVALVRGAAAFLGQSPLATASGGGGAAGDPLRAAEAAEQSASQRIAAIVSANGGIEPDQEYDQLQARALNASSAHPPSTQRLKRAFDAAQRYQAVLRRQSQAATAVSDLESQAAARNAQQVTLATAIPVSFEGHVQAPGDLTARARRVIASAAAGAVLGAALVLAVGSWGRRRRRRRSALS
jgi:hypothetical protein